MVFSDGVFIDYIRYRSKDIYNIFDRREGCGTKNQFFVKLDSLCR